ncbi:RNA polymerase-binding protein DksA [Coralloluteibacterium stylophorae]|uniref:RNA polymerase-binding protein DksA n=1 Tax=Coralloluteibacterium stylophorae TaxID=1776034 RepID=UPI003CCD7196
MGRGACRAVAAGKPLGYNTRPLRLKATRGVRPDAGIDVARASHHTGRRTPDPGRSAHLIFSKDAPVAVKKSAKKPASPAATRTVKTTAAKAPAKAAASGATAKAAPKKQVAAKATAPAGRTAAKGSVAKAPPKTSVSKSAVSKTTATKTAKKAAAPTSAPQAAEGQRTAARGGARARASAPSAQRDVTIKPAPETGKRVTLPAGYKPKAGEEYMSPMQLEYFRQRLLKWRDDLVEESKQTIENLKDEVRDVGDEAERATRETENSLELRTRDRYRKLINKIDSTLRRVDDGSYGYCVDTGEEIGLERLEARLTAERTIDAQERWEHLQKQMGD